MKKMKKRILAALLCTTMMLNTGVSAMADGGTAVSSESAHVHTEECYEKSKTDNLICTKAEAAEGHVHGDACYEVTGTKTLTCGLEETAGHSHEESCKEVTESLTCDKAEHSHEDGCKNEAGELTCGQEEHTHGGDCYTTETIVVCGQEETEGHTHGDGCYTVEETKTLICQTPEVEAHVHSDECYEWTEELTCGDKIETPAEAPEEPAGEEAETPEEPAGEAAEEPAEETPATEAEASEKPEAEKITLTEEVGENMTVEATADFPEGTKLTAAELTEEDEIYEAVVSELNEWAAAQEKEVLGFVGYDISMKDAEEEAVVLEDAAELEISYEEAVLPADVDGAKVTDVQFVHITENEEGELTAEEVGTVELDEEKAATAISFETATFSPFAALWMGDAEKAVEEAAEDATVKEPTYITLEKEVDGVKVTLTAEEGVVPEGAELSVTPITADNAETKEQYEEVEQQLADKIAEENEANEETKEIAGFLAYDIKLLVTDAEGNVTETEPDGEVKVSMEYKEAMLPETVENAEDLEVTVHHFEEDENGEVAQIVDMVAEENIEAAVTTTETAAVEKAEFVTESFSTYTVTWKVNNNNYQLEAQIVDETGTVIKGINNVVISKNYGEDEEYVFANECADITNGDDTTYTFVEARYTTSSFANGQKIYSMQFHDGYSRDRFQYKISQNSTPQDVSYDDRYTVYLVYKEVLKPLDKIPTITVETNNNVTITVNHYLGTTQLYQTKDHNLRAGKWVLEDITVTGNYDVVKIVDITDPENPVEVIEDVTVTTDKEYAVYYTPKTSTIDSVVQMFDYQVNSGDDGKGGIISINNPVNYPDSKENQRMSSGKENQSNQYYDYNTYISNGDINAYTNGNSPRKGIITGVDYKTGELELPLNTSNEQIYEPGFFVNEQDIMGHDVLTGYKLKFNQVGDTYTLDGVYKDGILQDSAGPEFYPLDNLRGEYTELSDDEHNHFFGMRYDIEFTLGEYVGDLDYTFTGDDDLWVVLDAANGGGQVVVDIGGIHQSYKDSVDLWQVLFPGKDRATLTEEDKSTKHTLTILYMERGAGESNCNMSFTLPNTKIIDPVRNNTLTITKTVSGNMIDSAKEFDFTVVIGDESTNFNLKDGQSKTFYIEKNTAPVIKVLENRDGYKQTVTTNSELQTSPVSEGSMDGITFTMPNSDAEVTFNNDKTAYVKIVKTWNVPNVEYIPDSLMVSIKNGSEVIKENIELTKEAEWTAIVDVNKIWTNDWTVTEELPDGLWISTGAWKDETEIAENGEVYYVYNLNNELDIKSASVQKQWHDGDNAYGTRDAYDTLNLTLKYSSQDGIKNSVVKQQNSNEAFFVSVKEISGTAEEKVVVIDDKEYTVEVEYSSWGAVVSGLPGCYEYTFVEENVPRGYIVGYPEVTSSEENVDHTIITNTLRTDFVKVSTESNSIFIKNAIFEMTSTIDGIEHIYFAKSESDGTLKWYKTYSEGVLDEDEEININNIPQATYTLKEIAAPAGYSLNTSEWTVNVANGFLHVTRIDGGEITINDYSKDSNSGEVTFFFKNEAVYELPSAGGFGIHFITLSGLALMLGAAYVWFANRRKEMFH